MSAKKKPDAARRRVAENRKARYNYFIEQEIEAGIVLVGTEVKSLRAGHANINDSFAEVRGGEVFLVNAHLPEYEFGNRFNHDARRPRKLLLHKREIDRLSGAVIRQGYTLVPLSIYFNDRGRAKVNLGLAKGKQMHDKRATEKERDWQREKARVLKDFG